MRVLAIVLDYLSFLPPAFLCFLPMKDMLRYSRLKTALIVGGVMLAAMLIFGWVQYRFGLESNAVLLPMLAICLFVYHSCQRGTLWQSLTILCSSVAFMSVLSNMAVCTGKLLFGAEANTKLYTPMLQLGFNAVFSGLLAIPYAKAGSYIVKEMRQNSTWQMLLLFSVLVFIQSMLMLPIISGTIQSAAQEGHMYKGT